MENREPTEIKEIINYYSSIIIDTGKRAFLFIIVFAVIVLFGSLIFENLVREGSWVTVAIPTTLLGSLFILFPPTEHWVYQAWQSKPRMFERHSVD
jgi:hypothetical protein